MDLTKVINGYGPPPSLVLELMSQLPPGSACEAINNDAPEMLGWDVSARLLANVSDWAQATMITAGEWPKGKTPKHRQEHRPWAVAQKRRAKEAKESEGIDINRLAAIFKAKADQGR